MVVPPIDGFHADAVLAQRDDHHSLGEIPSGPRAIVPEAHANILRPRLALLERASHGEERSTLRPNAIARLNSAQASFSNTRTHRRVAEVHNVHKIRIGAVAYVKSATS